MDIKKLYIAFAIFASIMIIGKIVKTHEKNKPVTNWTWPDEWQTNPGTMPSNPIQQPISPPIKKPDKQLTASSLVEAKKLSSEYGRPILIMFSADWCSYCEKMKNVTLRDASVQRVLMNYVFYIVDTDNDRDTTSLFGVRSLPTFVITDTSDTKIGTISGFQDSSHFIQFLSRIY